MTECDCSHMTPVCAGSFLTAMKYERSVVIAEVEAANMLARMSSFFVNTAVGVLPSAQEFHSI